MGLGPHVFKMSSKLNETMDGGIFSKSEGIANLIRLSDHCSVFLEEISPIGRSKQQNNIVDTRKPHSNLNGEYCS